MYNSIQHHINDIRQIYLPTVKVHNDTILAKKNLFINLYSMEKLK